MNGDTERIWNEFAPRLKQFIRKRVANEQDAEDILQQTFVKIHNRIDTLREETKLQGWLYQITRNAIIDYYRGRRVFEELPELSGKAEEPAEAGRTHELLPAVKAMMDCLDEKFRQPLVLTEFEGLSQKQMAGRLGLSLTAAKTRVQRGREKLKQLLLACCHFEFDRYGGVIDYEPKRSCDCCC
jgi:RNA polymerase sigma-70 factor (ECF subfamily)